MRLEHRWVIVLLLGTLTGVAQQPAISKTSDAAPDKPAVTGTVTGHVSLSDTKGPARKATVYLQPVAAFMTDAPNDHGQGQADGGVTIGVQTRVDGSFSFSHVAAGDYYVIALSPGYVSPYVARSLAEGRSRYAEPKLLGESQRAAEEAVLKTIPRITLQSGQATTVDITLERGAAISGNISYDDGSPAVGLQVDVLARMLQDGKETWAPFTSLREPRFTLNHTDDRGNYRISGLPAGTYVVEVTFDLSKSIEYISAGGGGGSGTNSEWSPLKLYSGNTTRLSDAAILSLDLGEERTGEVLRFPISKLHTVSGNIVSAHDGHIVNAGLVYLHNSADKTLAGSAHITEDDPHFTFSFIPEGEYVLTTTMSADVDYQLLPQQPGSLSPPQYESHPRHLYGSASKRLHVASDMDGVTIAVPEPTPIESHPPSSGT